MSTPIRYSSPEPAALHRSQSHRPHEAVPAATHLSLLVQQRTVGLSALSRTLSRVSTAQASLLNLVSELQCSVEAEVAAKHRDAAEGKRLKREREKREENVVKAYHDSLGRFEDEWTQDDALLRAWDIRIPTVRTGDEHERLSNLLDTLPPSLEASQTIATFLQSLLALDLYSLGQSFALQPLPATLRSTNSFSSPSALSTVFRCLSSASGAQAVLECAKGIWETAIREITGRERGPASPDLEGGAEEGGIGLGLGLGLGLKGRKEDEKGEYRRKRRNQREKELEEFLIGTLEVLDELSLEVDIELETAGEAGNRPCPLDFHTPAIESLLLSFLQTTRTMVEPSPTAAREGGSHARAPSETWSPSPSLAFLSTSFTTLTSAPLSAARTVSSAASSLPSALYTFGLPHSTVSALPPSPERRTPSAPKTPSSPASPNKPLPRSPQSPSSSFHFASSSVTSSPLILTTAASFLRNLTPSLSSSRTQSRVPLIELLFRHLLTSSFSTRELAAERQKILNLALVRWFAFSRLGSFLQSPTSTTRRPAHSPGISPGSGSGSQAAKNRDSADWMRGAFVSSSSVSEALGPLHRTIYGAVTQACGLSASTSLSDDDGDPQAGEQRELRKAAEDFVASFSLGPSVGVNLRKETAKREGMRAVVLDREELEGLWETVGEVVASFVPVREGPKMAGRDGHVLGEDARMRQKVKGVFAALRHAPVVPGDTGRLAVFYISPASAIGAGGLGVQVTLSPPLPSAAPSTPTDHPHDLPFSAADLALLRRAFALLLASSSLPISDDLLASFTQAFTAAHTSGRYADYVLFSRAHSILSSHSSPAAPALLAYLSAPFLFAQKQDETLLSVSHARLQALAAQHSRLLCSARTALEDLEQLRERAFHLSVLSSPLASRLVSRIEGLSSPARTKAEREQGKREVEAWREELGVVDLFPPNSATAPGNADREKVDEALMLVETAAALATEEEALSLNSLFRREAAFLSEPIMAQGALDPVPTGLASTILAAPGVLWNAIPLPPSPFPSIPSFHPAPTSTAAQPATSVLVPRVGGVSPTLASLFPPVSASLEDQSQQFSQCLSTSLVSYLFSYFSSTLPSLLTPLDVDLVLATASYPLSRTLQTPPNFDPPSFLNTLLNRFISHPDFQTKLDNLLELERAIAALVEVGELSVPKEVETPTSNRVQKKEYDPFRTLPRPPSGNVGAGAGKGTLGTRRKRMNSASSLVGAGTGAGAAGLRNLFAPAGAEEASPSSLSTGQPTQAYLDAGGADGVSGSRVGTLGRRSRSRMSSASADLPDLPIIGSSTSFPFPSASSAPSISPAPPSGSEVEEDVISPAPLSTDTLLPLLELILAHFLSFRPPSPSPRNTSESSTTPPSDLSRFLTTLHRLSHLLPIPLAQSSSEAKAFWDVAAAGMALREEVLKEARASEGSGGSG